MNIIVFSLFTILILSSVSLAREYTDNELLALSEEAFSQRLLVKSEKDRVIAFRRVLENHSDEDKIKAIALFLFSTDADESHYMRSSNAMIPGYALGQDRDLIQDWSKLRSMIREERDPRRFYLLSCIKPWPRDGFVYDFIPEMSHMLFASGRVAKEEGEYTKPYAHDVSLYTYKAITGTLKLLNAEYEPLSGLSWNRESHEKKILHLANWLINNWPGCEDIQIPTRFMQESRPDSRRDGLLESTPELKSPSNIEDAGIEASETKSNYVLQMIISLVVLVILSVAFILKKANHES